MKSPAPRHSYSSKDEGSEYERLRGIEREYELVTVAEHARQLVQFQAVSLRVLAGQASRTLGHLASMTGSLSAGPTMMGGPGSDVRAIMGGVDTLGLSGSTPAVVIPQLPSPTESDDHVTGLQTVLVELFDRVAKHILKEQKALRLIANSLRETYEAPFLGMRNEAEKWLISGMKRSGRDRDEDFNDALRLLRASLDSPFGNSDYVAWFQLGWLLWQHEQNLVDAEDSFYKAQRLSASHGDLYYIKSLRHLAYMQYLRVNYAGAYETVQKALTISPDHETRFEAARYAAMLGSGGESIRLLEMCIRERPTTIIAMFAEIDFLRAPDGTKLLNDMADLASRLLAEARMRTNKNLQHWRMGLMIVESAEKLIGHNISLPEDVCSQALGQISDVSQADYLMALEIDRRSLASGDKVLHIARDSLKMEVRDATSLLGKAQGELEKLEFASRRRMTEALDWKDEQISEMPSLMKLLGGKGRALNLMFPFIGAFMVWAGKPFADYMVQNTPLAASTVGQFGYQVFLALVWFICSLIVFGIAQMCDVVLQQRLRARIEKVYDEVIRVDEAQSSGELGALRKTVWEATRRKQKAEEALRLIEP